MKMQESEKRRHLGHILWFIFVVNVLIFLLAIIFGGPGDLIMSLKAHFWLALIITVISFLMIAVGLLLGFSVEASGEMNQSM
jgi:amino acid transporter